MKNTVRRVVKLNINGRDYANSLSASHALAANAVCRLMYNKWPEVPKHSRQHQPVDWEQWETERLACQARHDALLKKAVRRFLPLMKKAFDKAFEV